MTSSSTNSHPQQLALISVEPAARPQRVPSQFQLSAKTRRRGLQHVEEIRRQLAAQAARRRVESLGTRADAA